MKKLKTQTIPCLVMLVGGCTVTVISLISHYPSKDTLKVLLISLLVSYFIGKLIKIGVDKIEIPTEIVENKTENPFEENTEDSNADEDGEGEETEDYVDGEAGDPLDLESFLEDEEADIVAPQYEDEDEM